LPPPGDEGSASGTIQPALDPAALQPAEAPLIDTRVVRRGDNLSRLAADVYGFATKEVLQRVAERNPGIADVNRILVGTAIRFPDVSDLQARRSGPATPGQ
jgi:phage tail protein X